MSYIPHTEAEREQMLSAIGVDSIETMFDAVPAALRFPQLDLPAPQSQLEVMELMTALAEANECAAEYALFRGAGSYHHFIPLFRQPPHPAWRIPHRLYALPTGNDARHAASDLRIPEHAMRIDRDGRRQRQPL